MNRVLTRRGKRMVRFTGIISARKAHFGAFLIFTGAYFARKAHSPVVQ